MLCIAMGVQAQEPPEGLMGEDFRVWVKQNFYDGEHSALSYSDARKKMFGYASNDNGFIECFYSGLRQVHAEGLEISFPEPFNTEHVVPQFLFDGEEPMRSDIHILQPTFQDWNNLRSNYQFRELDDVTETDQWIYLNQSTESIPSSNIELYSEYVFGGWEPREESKGDVARAFMYFFTMYPQFDMEDYIDTSILCQWHEEDTISAYELQRNESIEFYQGNVNPYISNPWWANMAYGCDVEVPPVINAAFENILDIGIYPNPSNGRIQLELPTAGVFPLYAELTGMDGRSFGTREIMDRRSTLTYDVPNGSYFLVILNGNGELQASHSLIISGN